MKQELTLESALELISTDKRAAVQPFLQEVFDFYGTVAMEPGTGQTSEFSRHATFTPPTAQPLIRILARDGEEGLVHELLHLYMPLREGVYALYFPDGLSVNLSELSNLVQNVVEHELMIDMFLGFGYSQGKFQHVFKNADYRREKRQGPPYWLYTYLRHVMLLRHLPAAEHVQVRASLASMRKVALDRFPALGSGFQRVRAWVEARAHHNPAAYPQALAELFAIIGYGTPTRYLKPDANRLLSSHNI